MLLRSRVLPILSQLTFGASLIEDFGFVFADDPVQLEHHLSLNFTNVLKHVNKGIANFIQLFLESLSNGARFLGMKFWGP